MNNIHWSEYDFRLHNLFVILDNVILVVNKWLISNQYLFDQGHSDWVRPSKRNVNRKDTSYFNYALVQHLHYCPLIITIFRSGLSAVADPKTWGAVYIHTHAISFSGLSYCCTAGLLDLFTEQTMHHSHISLHNYTVHFNSNELWGLDVVVTWLFSAW